METHSFRRVSGDTLRKLCVPQNFHTRKLGEIKIFYAVNVHRNDRKASRRFCCLDFRCICLNFPRVLLSSLVTLQMFLLVLTFASNINPLQASVAFLYPLKTPEKLKGFLMFSGGIEKQHLAVMG